MKAIVSERYGPPESLQFVEVEKPIPKENEVLIKVHASSLNAADFEILRGAWTARFTGLRKPGQKIPGSDVAGTIEAVGNSVTTFQPGDEVMGDLFYSGKGAFAEFVSAPEKVLTYKPAKMTFAEAATYPQAGIIALQALRGERQIQPEQKVLVNGAGGGMGTFAVQIAKYYDAEVTGVDSEMKLDMLRSIGADHVIDYAEEDFTKSSQCYDIIIDTVAKRSIYDYEHTLCEGGLFVMVGGSRKAIFQAVFLGPWISRRGTKKLGLNLWGEPYNQADMDFLEELYNTGKVMPVIDRKYRLSEVPEAYQYLEEGKALGKLVVTMEEYL
ncbi:MAG: NAD(P)-dependent alcohol dehydrogenase [Candidatus Thorarchaeota archaeon]